jgi:hypothetical protein
VVLGAAWVCLISHPNIDARAAGNRIAVAPATSILNVDHISPGDSFLAAITLGNGGRSSLAYTLWAEAKDGRGKHLGDLLVIEVRSVSGRCDAASFARSTDRIVSAGALRAMGVSTSRVLAPGEVETACIRFVLPLEVGNESQGASTVVTIHVGTTHAP